MRVGGLILHYRNWPEVAETIRSALASECRIDPLIVIDNCSADGSASEIRTTFPQLHVIALTENRGYAAGMNHGILQLLQAGCDAVLLLTHEVLLAPDAVGLLADRLRDDPTIAVVGPLLGRRDRPEEVWSAGGVINERSWSVSHRGAGDPVEEWTRQEPVPADWVDGSVLLVRSAAVCDEGLFDESYFLYFEENDYLQRLQRAGWRVECVPRAVAWQQPGRVPLALWQRNWLRFVARHAPRRTLVRALRVSATAMARDVRRVRHPKARARVAARVEGLIGFALRRSGPPSAKVPR